MLFDNEPDSLDGRVARLAEWPGHRLGGTLLVDRPAANRVLASGQPGMKRCPVSLGQPQRPVERIAVIVKAKRRSWNLAIRNLTAPLCRRIQDLGIAPRSLTKMLVALRKFVLIVVNPNLDLAEP